MIRLSTRELAAIGAVAIESGTLERELGEYLIRLAVPSHRPAEPIGTRVKSLSRHLASGVIPRHVLDDFSFVLAKITLLLEQRNAITHGTWSETSNAPVVEVKVVGKAHKSNKTTVVNALEIEGVVTRLHDARKLLLRLLHDHLPQAVGTKSSPKRTAAELRARLI